MLTQKIRYLKSTRMCCTGSVNDLLIKMLMRVTFTISREMFVNAIGIQTVVYGVLLQVSMLLYCTDTQ